MTICNTKTQRAKSKALDAANKTDKTLGGRGTATAQRERRSRGPEQQPHGGERQASAGARVGDGGVQERAGGGSVQIGAGCCKTSRAKGACPAGRDRACFQVQTNSDLQIRRRRSAHQRFFSVRGIATLLSISDDSGALVVIRHRRIHRAVLVFLLQLEAAELPTALTLVPALERIVVLKMVVEMLMEVVVQDRKVGVDKRGGAAGSGLVLVLVRQCRNAAQV